jgi:hypothetical protein
MLRPLPPARPHAAAPPGGTVALPRRTHRREHTGHFTKQGLGFGRTNPPDRPAAYRVELPDLHDHSAPSAETTSSLNRKIEFSVVICFRLTPHANFEKQ